MKPANKIRLLALVMSVLVLSVIGFIFFSDEGDHTVNIQKNAPSHPAGPFNI